MLTACRGNTSTVYWMLALLVVALATGCSSVEVSQDYQKDADFSGISSFAWKSDTQEKTGDIRMDSPLMDERVRKALDQALTGRGFEKTTHSKADILVQYRLESRQKVRSDNVRGGFGFGYGTYGRHGGILIGTGGNVETYDEGLLVIDLMRSGSEELLWRGNATFRMPDHSTPEKTTERINEAVEKTLGQFPPEAAEP